MLWDLRCTNIRGKVCTIPIHSSGIEILGQAGWRQKKNDKMQSLMRKSKISKRRKRDKYTSDKINIIIQINMEVSNMKTC